VHGKKIIVISKRKNPRLYRVVNRKGGTVVFSSMIMTTKKVPLKNNFIELLILKIKHILNIKII
jgi:hypothetical protein